MPDIFGIRFEYPQLHTLEYVKAHGVLWNDDDFSFQSYWEGSINHYERLFYRHGNQAEAPFSGLLCELYPNDALRGYACYVSGCQEDDDADFYPDGQIKKYGNFCKAELKSLILEWDESGQIRKIMQLTDRGRHVTEVEYDASGNIINHYER